ncbi:hypothetical protein BIFADO_02049 [Bifidobacterium adolescentis L2-32]|uniref:Uncharacterized protein n=1 Tax=Bifidobacterium adolescentis L2-32 TaxID=411481 RepID=A7A859_BIFAD|nr:hypothetical protein BIFADO_02049 [Bifidobacterium adolescentis L2-32]
MVRRRPSSASPPSLISGSNGHIVVHMDWESPIGESLGRDSKAFRFSSSISPLP